jgi:D-3-phosphoglycerate dehydrogenase
MLCVITDYMGDDTTLEESLLSEAGFEAFVASSHEPENWAEQAVGADAILTRHAPVREDLIRRLEKCKVISRYGTGHDNIDVPAAHERGIVVTNVPDYCTPEAADHTMALLLASARHLGVLSDSVRQGDWTPDPLPPILRIGGRTLGMVGYGRIGAAVAERARAFGLRVWVYDPYLKTDPEGARRFDDLDEMLGQSDFLTFHTPLTDETRGLLDERRIGLLPEGAIVVNCARGPMVDIPALIAALESGHLAAAALDVTPQEPPDVDDPVRRVPGLLVTPHTAYYSQTSVEEAKRNSVGEIIRVIRGEEPLNPVVL